jgi:Family of unknown function (DUF5958)
MAVCANHSTITTLGRAGSMDALPVMLNATAQALITPEHSIIWFQALPRPQQTTAVRLLALYILQADRTLTTQERDTTQALLRGAVGHPATAASLPRMLEAALGSPQPPDLTDVYQTLMAIFTRVDQLRRATVCSHGCGHWWHHL